MKKFWLYSVLLGVSISVSTFVPRSVTAMANANSTEKPVKDTGANTSQIGTENDKNNEMNSADYATNNGSNCMNSSVQHESDESIDDAAVENKSNGVNDISSTDVNSGVNSDKDVNTDYAVDTANQVSVTKNETVIPNKGVKPTIDNKLIVNTSAQQTLSSVTSNAGDRYSFNTDTETATLTDVKDSDTVTATYKNIGTYQGKSIDAVLQVGHLILHTADHPAPNKLPADVAQLKFFNTFSGGVAAYNIAQDELLLKFFYESGEPVTVNGDGYITIGSLNGPSINTTGNEYVSYNNGESMSYVTQDTVVSSVDNPNTGEGSVYAGTSSNFTDILGAPTSENGAITFQLIGSTFSFTNGTTRYSMRSRTHHWSYALTTLSSATVAPAKIPEAVLTVDKESATPGDVLTYVLSQQVNVLGQDTLLRYQSWQESLILPVGVTYQSASFLDEKGKEIAGNINFDDKTRTLIFTLGNEYLQGQMPMSGESYRLVVKTTVNGDIEDESVGSANAEREIDEKVQKNLMATTEFVNKRTLVVHYFKQGTTTKLHPDTQFTVGFGKHFNIPATQINGYQLVKEENNTGTFGIDTKDDVIFEFATLNIPSMVKIRIVDVSDKGEVLSSHIIEGVKGEKFHISPVGGYGTRLIYAGSSEPLTGVFDSNKVIVNRYNYSYPVTEQLSSETTEVTTVDGLNRIAGVYLRSDNSGMDIFVNRSPKLNTVKVYAIDSENGKILNRFQAKSGQHTLKVKSFGSIRMIQHKNGSVEVYEPATENEGQTKGILLTKDGTVSTLTDLKVRVQRRLVEIETISSDKGPLITLKSNNQKKVRVYSNSNGHLLRDVGNARVSSKQIRIHGNVYSLRPRNNGVVLNIAHGYEKASYIFDKEQGLKKIIEIENKNGTKLVRTNIYNNADGFLAYQEIKVVGNPKRSVSFSTNADLREVAVTKIGEYSAVLTNTARAVHITIYRHGRFVKEVVTNADTKKIWLDSQTTLTLHQTDNGQNIITFGRSSQISATAGNLTAMRMINRDKVTSRYIYKNGEGKAMITDPQWSFESNVSMGNGTNDYKMLPRTNEKATLWIPLIGLIMNLGVIEVWKKWLN